MSGESPSSTRGLQIQFFFIELHLLPARLADSFSQRIHREVAPRGMMKRRVQRWATKILNATRNLPTSLKSFQKSVLSGGDCSCICSQYTSIVYSCRTGFRKLLPGPMGPMRSVDTWPMLFCSSSSVQLLRVAASGNPPCSPELCLSSVTPWRSQLHTTV